VKEVVFHVSPTKNEMDKDYFVFIDEVKQEIRRQRLRITLNANVEMICSNWNIGNAVLRKQEDNGWGAKVIDRMSKDIRDTFPDMKGVSPRNIKYMRKFAEAWDDFEFVQRGVAQIPRRTNIALSGSEMR